MLECTVIGLAPFFLVVGGFGLLWTRASLHQRGRLSAEGGLAQVLTILGWCLLVAGFIAGIGIAANMFGLILAPAVIVLLLGAVRMHRTAEQQALLRVLTAAAERGIPLHTAAQGFAEERVDAIGARARDLADFLDAGVPLGLALRRSHGAMPTAALLAADLGERTDTLGPALRQAVIEIDELEMTLRSVLEKFFYLALVILVAAGMLAYLMIRIIPVFQRLLVEFEVEAPEVTRWLIAVSEAVVRDWYITFPVAGLLTVALVVGLLYYVRFSPRDLPFIRILWSRVDSALAMHWLAIGIEQKRPIGEVIRLLAGYFPRAGMRFRLQAAVKRIDDGANWCDSLRRVGIVRHPESVVFKAAERTGNLVWALKEMADSSVRRTAYRMRAWLGVAFPVALIAVGLSVLLIALAILTPLVSMLQQLT